MGGVQVGHQYFDLGLEGGRGPIDELPASGREGDLHAATVAGGGGPGHEPSFLGSVDQAGHTRFIQLEESRQLHDGRRTVPKDCEQPGLDDREVVGGSDAPESALHAEAQLSQSVDQSQVWLAWERSQDRAADGRGHSASVGQI